MLVTHSFVLLHVTLHLLEQFFIHGILIAHSHSMAHQLSLLHDGLRTFHEQFDVIELRVNLTLCFLHVVHFLVEGWVLSLD